jgi:hypothetical protein
VEVGLGYSFDEDGLIRLQKDLNHLLTNLNDQNVRSIRTEYCVVSAKGRETIIDGSLLEMYDFDIATSKATTTLRLRAGYNKLTSNFEFSLWNTLSTTPTISLDSIGNAVFSGNINTSHSIFVGDNIFLGQTGSTVTKGLYFNSSTPSLYEDEGSSDMRSALYTKFETVPWTTAIKAIAVGFNSSGAIDVISHQGTYIQHNFSTSIAVSTAHYNIDYFPHLILGDQDRYNVFFGFRGYRTTDLDMYFYTTNLAVGKGYIEGSIQKDYLEKIKMSYCENGKMLDEFQSTVGWVPNTAGRLECATSNKRCIGTQSLAFVCSTSSAGDLIAYKHFTDMNLLQTNGGRGLSSNSIFYILFYLYDLGKINLLSTKTMQVELASSSSLGDKYRWVLDDSTTASVLTTGWNIKTKKLSAGYYYLGTFNPVIFKYARLSFEVNANSSGIIAAVQALGIVPPTSEGSSYGNFFPYYDDMYDSYGRSIDEINYDTLWWGVRHTTDGVAVYSLGSMSPTHTFKDLWPSVKVKGNSETVWEAYTGDLKLTAKVKCKNDLGRLPYIGMYCSRTLTTNQGYLGIWATTNAIRLECVSNTSSLTDESTIFSPILYNDVFNITITKTDPEIYNSTALAANVQALIEKVGSTLMTYLSYELPHNYGKGEAFVPVIGSCEEAVGAEILEFKWSRR